jgi:hypothetical protein
VKVMKSSRIQLVGAALLLTLGFATASVETVAAAPTVSVAASTSDITIARYDARYDNRRDNRYRYRARCRTEVHYGWRNRACVRVQQQVCRNGNGRTYVTNRSVVRVARFHCR